MGKQKDMQLEGTYEDVIFYKSNGRFLIRSKGRTGTQAPIAKVQAGILGKASALSARIRTSVSSLLPNPKSRELMYKLNNVLQEWLRTNPSSTEEQQNSIGSLNGFVFAGEDELVKMFATAMPVSRTTASNLSLYIPSFDSPNPIAPLPFSGQINLKVIAVGCDINYTDNIEKQETTLNINYTGIPVPAQPMSISMQTGKGKLVVVAVSVNEVVAGIVGSFYN